MNKVLLIIPAYNEEANIQMVVEELRDHYPELDYVVVNDGSSDRTARNLSHPWQKKWKKAMTLSLEAVSWTVKKTIPCG